MSIIIDVIVIGAGPAGTITSKVCGENGLKIALLEKNTQPGLKLCAGGICNPGFLSEFGLDTGLIESKINCQKYTLEDRILSKKMHALQFIEEFLTVFWQRRLFMQV